jgi:hypothetical protein
MTAATMPPMSIQMALSVGDPVKNLETSEPKEFVALIPSTMSTTPPTSRTIGMSLFIMYGLPSFSAPNEPHQDHDDGYHQQDMDYASHSVAADQSQQPKNY